MTKRSTKRAVALSFVSLLLCVSMFIGTTFAWFTDSVTSAKNQIVAGNLDVELEYAKVENGRLSAWETVSGKDDIFDPEALWEPGRVEVVYLKVSNLGTLALKYQLSVNVYNEIAGINVANEAFKLSDYLVFKVVDLDAEPAVAYTREEAIKEAGTVKGLKSYNGKTTALEVDGEDYVALIVYMPETVGNEANYKTGTATPTIELGVNLFATQVEAEKDSFGPDYDEDAAIFVSNSADLRTAIANVKEYGTVYVNDGVYDIDSQLTIAGKSLNIVGVGENAVINMTDTRKNYNKIFYIYGNAEGKDVTVNISNVTLTAPVATKSDIWVRTDASNGAKVNGNVTVNLDNVTCTSIICDNNYVDGDTVNLNITNSTVKKVALDASPFNGNGLNTYTNLTYTNSRLDSITINPAVNDLTHIKINGVNPTAHGEQQILDYVDTVEELQAALDNAEDGDVIVFGTNITGDVKVTQKNDVKVTIDGNGKNFAGYIIVDGKSATYTTAGLTIKNLNFVADSITEDACINLGKDGDNNTRYTCNVTVDNCTFDVPGAVGVKSYTGGDKNVKIIGCTATANTHSLAQLKGVDGVLVQNCKVYSKNGINFNNSDNVTVDGCTVDVKGYAVRFGESSGGVGAAETYAIKNSTLKSACEDGDSVIILRGTADYSTLTITNTTITGTSEIKNTATGATVVK